MTSLEKEKAKRGVHNPSRRPTGAKQKTSSRLPDERCGRVWRSSYSSVREALWWSNAPDSIYLFCNGYVPVQIGRAGTNRTCFTNAFMKIELAADVIRRPRAASPSGLFSQSLSPALFLHCTSHAPH